MSKYDIYGEGYEMATQDGPDVEYIPKTRLPFGDWTKRYFDLKYYEESKNNKINNLKSLNIPLTEGNLNDFHEYCYYRVPIKVWKQTKEDVMQKTILDLKLEIEDLKQGMNNKIDSLFTKVVMLEREQEKAPKENLVDVFKKLIIKYCPKYEAFLKDNTEFDVIYSSLYNTNRISIKYPSMYTEFSFAIMKATLEFCNEVMPDSKVIFADNRVMTIQIANKK